MSETLELEDLEDLECALEAAETKAGRTARRRTAIQDVPPGADWNDVEHAILTRRSIRKFKGRQPPAHLIRRILEMGRFAPSQGNCQPWSFIVVRDKAIITQMEEYCVAVCKTMTANIDYTNYEPGSDERAAIMRNTQELNRQSPNSFHPVPMTAIKSIAKGRFAVFHKAPTVILILMDRRGVGVPEIDIGVVGQNIVLAAQSLGLGTCWIGFSKLLASNTALTETLGVAPPFEIAEAICVGYPIGNPTQQDVSRQTHQIVWWEDGEKQVLYLGESAMTAEGVDKAVVAPDHFPIWDDPREAIYRRVTIELDKCDGCKLCTVVCPANILELYGPKDNLKVRLKADATGCMSCNNCYAVCAGQGVYATEPYDFAGYYEQKGIGAFAFARRF